MSFYGKQTMDLSSSLERMSAKDMKSAEQIRRHSIDARLEGKTAERALHIFTIGDEVQKLSVVSSLPELLVDDRNPILQSLVPKMLQGLSGSSTEYQVTMSSTVQTIAKDKILPPQLFIDHFLQALVQNLDHKDIIVASSWCDALLEAIQVLPVEYLKQHIINIAAQRTVVTRPAYVRSASCNIIGELSLRFDLALIKKDIIPLVMSLTNDMDVDVKVSMAVNLTKVIKALKVETFRTVIGPALIDLAGDEITRVKEAAFRTISNVVDVVGPENIRNSMLPAIKQLIHFAFKTDDSLLVVISECYGKICLGIDKVTTEKEMFVKYYITMAGLGAAPGRKKIASFPEPAFHMLHTALNPEKYVLCRQAAATNFPAMCKFVEGHAPLTELLMGTLNDLNTDSYYVVRRIVGQGIAETCSYLGKSTPILKNNVLQLLSDEAEEVLDGFFPNLSAVIDGLMKAGVYRVDPPPKDTSVNDLNKAILRCENIIFPSHNWRLYTMFMAQIECVYKFNASDIQFNSYISLFLKRMHATRTVPVRVSLMKTVLVFLRYLQKPSQRSEVRNRIINEFCQSTSFYNRIFYIRTCYLILDLYSTSYFKEYFFFRTLQLIDDPTPNVRWALLMMLPKLKQMSKHPSEKKMQALVDAAVVKFADDKDREIMRQFESVKNSLDVPDQKLFLNDTRKLEEEKKLLGGAEGNSRDAGGGGGGGTSSAGPTLPGGLRKPPGSDSRSNQPSLPSGGGPNRPGPPRSSSASPNPSYNSPKSPGAGKK